jgi:hypothetical protein
MIATGAPHDPAIEFPQVNIGIGPSSIIIVIYGLHFLIWRLLPTGGPKSNAVVARISDPV